MQKKKVHNKNSSNDFISQTLFKYLPFSESKKTFKKNLFFCEFEFMSFFFFCLQNVTMLSKTLPFLVQSAPKSKINKNNCALRFLFILDLGAECLVSCLLSSEPKTGKFTPLESVASKNCNLDQQPTCHPWILFTTLDRKATI